MAADPRDDFSVFAGSEHMFYGLADPYGMIRDLTQESLQRQVSDAAIEHIKCSGAPKWLTMGRKLDDGKRMIVTHFAFCVQARIAVTSRGGRDREEMDATMTFLLGKMDEPGKQVSSMYLDLHEDAQARFDDKVLQQRFAAFRQSLP